MSISTICRAEAGADARARRRRPRPRPCRRRTGAAPASARRSAGPQARAPGAPSGRGARIRIGGIGAAHGCERGEGVVDGEREHRDAIERAAGRHHAGGGDEAEARLEADDVAEPRRHAAGAGGVGAERERHEAGGDRDRRARARSAGNQRRIEQVARNAVGRAHADEAGGELVEIGLADDDGAGGFQPGDAGRVLARLVGEGRAGGGGRQSLDVDIVLHRDRHAIEREAGIALRRQRPGFGDGVRLVAKRDEDGRIGVGADARVAARDRRFGAASRPNDAPRRSPLPCRPTSLSLPVQRVSKQHASRSGAMPAPLRHSGAPRNDRADIPAHQRS